MLSYRRDTFKYTAIVRNISQDTDLSDYVNKIQIKLPNVREISSLNAIFNLDYDLIDEGNEIEITVLDEVGNVVYSITGEAKMDNKKLGYIADTYSYTVVDDYNKRFNRIIPKNEVFYDLYVSNENDKHNSLIHIIADKLGFDGVVADTDLTRIPFVIFRENDRWIDELQSLIAGTDSAFYIKDKKLHFKILNADYCTDLEFNDKNIVQQVEVSDRKELYNGVKVLFDRYKRLENQVVFDIASKLILQPKTSDSSVFTIAYSTSTVANPGITKATGYYFKDENPDSIVKVELQEGKEYEVLKLEDTGAEIKFKNPYGYILYIDNFEISGVPLVMFADNESVIKDSNVLEESDENFIIIPKNKYIQTDTQAEKIGLMEYNRQVAATKVYSFYTHLLPGIEIGQIYRLYLRGIDTAVRVLSYEIDLEPSNFTSFITAQEVRTDVITKKSNTDSLNPTTDFINLAPITKKIEIAEEDIKEVTQKVHSKLHTSETQPTENVCEHDVWLKKSTNQFKIYLNKKWVPVAEEDLLPSIKHFNSLENARLEIGRVNDRAGLFLLNDDEKFGSINGDLAEVTLDKQGSIRLKNVNNLLEWNVKDPKDPKRMRSKFYMGVHDISKVDDDTYFKVGDEATGFSLELKEGKSIAKLDGKELKTKLEEDKREIADKFKTADGKLTELQQNYENTVGDMQNFKTETTANIGTLENALDTGNFVVNGNTVFDGATTFVSRGDGEDAVRISNGAIEFLRTVDGRETKLTHIRNIRYGTVSTNSSGSGVVNFDGFRQPMLVFPTVKSANFGKNMASIFCYAEHLGGVKYKFFVGGTNEDVREARAIKNVGTTWSANSAVATTLLGWTGDYSYFTQEYPVSRVDRSTYERAGAEGIRRKPRIQVTIFRNNEVLFREAYTANVTTRWRNSNMSKFEYSLSFNFSKSVNMFKKFANRTNVTYEMQIQILESKLEACFKYKHSYEKNHGGRDGGTTTVTDYYLINGTMHTIGVGDFRNLSITASAETSTISSATGYGEVGYIAMEIH